MVSLTVGGREGEDGDGCSIFSKAQSASTVSRRRGKPRPVNASVTSTLLHSRPCNHSLTHCFVLFVSYEDEENRKK